jgi:hypothetical protein
MVWTVPVMSTSHPAPLSEVSATFLVELRAVREWAVYAGDTRKAVLAGMLLDALTAEGYGSAAARDRTPLTPSPGLIGEAE